MLYCDDVCCIMMMCFLYCDGVLYYDDVCCNTQSPVRMSDVELTVCGIVIMCVSRRVLQCVLQCVLQRAVTSLFSANGCFLPGKYFHNY